MNRGEPQRFAPFVEGTEVAARCDNAVIVVDHLLIVVKHRLDCCRSLVAIELCHFAPDELAAHPGFDYGMKGEGEGIQVLWFHVGAQDTWGILKELLAVDDRHQEVRAQVSCASESFEYTP